MRSLVALFLALTVGCTGSPSSNGPKGQADAGETSVADTKPTATDAGAATVTDAEPSAAAVCEAISLATRDGDGPASLLDKPSLQTGPIDKAISGSGPGGGHRVAQVSLAGKQLLVVAFDVVALDDPLAEVGGHVLHVAADSRDIGRGRADEGDQALPGVLPYKAQPMIVAYGGAHTLVEVDSAVDVVQIVVQPEVIADQRLQGRLVIG